MFASLRSRVTRARLARPARSSIVGPILPVKEADETTVSHLRIARSDTGHQSVLPPTTPGATVAVCSRSARSSGRELSAFVPFWDTRHGRRRAHAFDTALTTSAASRSICSASSKSGWSWISSAPASATSRRPAMHAEGGPETATAFRLDEP